MTNTIYIHQPEKAFSFTRLPNFLFEAPTFKPLSNEAKVLYAFILRRTDRASRSRYLYRDRAECQEECDQYFPGWAYDGPEI